MTSLFKKVFYAGVGIITTTSEKLQSQIDELVEKGKLSEEEGRKVVEEMKDNAEAKKDAFEGKIKDMVTKTIDSLNLPTATELKKVVARIESLETKVKKTNKETKATTKPVTRRAKTVAKPKVVARATTKTAKAVLSETKVTAKKVTATKKA